MAEILVLVAHPELEHSHVNRALAGAASSAAAASDGRIEVVDLYARYPDFLIDVAAEQARLAEARLVVWQQPIHWYGMTPLLRLWVDDVFAFNWAYGPEGRALRGKDLWLVGSTGGPEESYRAESYNRYPFDAFLPPYEQTATLCGMRFLPPLLLHGAHRASRDAIAAHAEAYVAKLAAYPDWPGLASVADCPDCAVPESARPSEPVSA